MCVHFRGTFYIRKNTNEILPTQAKIKDHQSLICADWADLHRLQKTRRGKMPETPPLTKWM